MRRGITGLVAVALAWAMGMSSPSSAGPSAQPAPDGASPPGAQPTSQPDAAGADAPIKTADPFEAPAKDPRVETIDPFGVRPGAEPAAGPSSDGAPLRDEGPTTDAPIPTGVESRREAMETDMAELGALVQDARREGDMVRLECLLDVQKRAQNVLEVATSELLVIRDGNMPADARRFAAEKLAAAAERLHALLEQGRACAGEQGPEDEDDETRNEVDEPDLVPFADPTRASDELPLPPAIEDTRPPVVASPSS